MSQELCQALGNMMDVVPELYFRANYKDGIHFKIIILKVFLMIVETG